MKGRQELRGVKGGGTVTKQDSSPREKVVDGQVVSPRRAKESRVDDVWRDGVVFSFFSFLFYLFTFSLYLFI